MSGSVAAPVGKGRHPAKTFFLTMAYEIGIPVMSFTSLQCASIVCPPMPVGKQFDEALCGKGSSKKVEKLERTEARYAFANGQISVS